MPQHAHHLVTPPQGTCIKCEQNSPNTPSTHNESHSPILHQDPPTSLSPLPSTPCPNPVTPCTGPKSFLQNVLQEDNNMDMLGHTISPLPSTPASPATPTSPAKKLQDQNLLDMDLPTPLMSSLLSPLPIAEDSL
ncbi:hypothetical protein BDR07DRAFT_1494871 [Suillus spraguei]|nr:hypothetical protein BDR07DRAFT_1494871 [Suillus spraguei]